VNYHHSTNIDSHWLVREEQLVYDSRAAGKLSRKRKRYRLIDVFAGAGGMTLGFSKSFGHAFDSVWANDFDDCLLREFDVHRQSESATLFVCYACR
jgi:DNA (cytosine-5)-methyltransferase 1